MDGRALAGSAWIAGHAWARHWRQVRRAAMPPRLFVEPNRPSGHGVTICTSLCNGHSSIAPRAAWIGRRDLAERLAVPLEGLRRVPNVEGGACVRSTAVPLRVLPAWRSCPPSTMPNVANQILSELEAGRIVVNTARLLTQVVLQTLIGT
jgi:hypothetical protein